MPINFTPPPYNDINNPSKEILVKVDDNGNAIFLRENLPYNGDVANIPPDLLSTTANPNLTTINPNKISIIPPSGFWSSFSEGMLSGSFPESLSSAKWSDNAKGFPQQTFLGASIRSFTMQGGFGDTSSSLTVDLIVDEYNASDKTPYGKGDDVYHSGGSIAVNDLFINHPQVPKQPKFLGDNFVPPIPGSPVFFKFGPNFATVEEAYRKTFDDLYYYNTITEQSPTSGGGTNLKNVLDGKFNFTGNTYLDLNLPDAIDGGAIPNEFASRSTVNYGSIRSNKNSRGKDHIVFGGILQTYTQSRALNGNPLYTVNVIDPREILSNVTLILNNYAGPTYEQPNVMNLYGFLEYNPSPQGLSQVKAIASAENKLKKEVVTTGPNMGTIVLTGDDKYYKTLPAISQLEAIRVAIRLTEEGIAECKRKASEFRSQNNLPGAEAQYDRLITLSNLLKTEKIKLQQAISKSSPLFPMTGTGFSRRSSQGIPYYRVKDAINALMEFYAPLPKEYKDQGFGGKINFRGFNYVVDFSGLPELPELYYLDFDEINLLELALEICDITNRDLFVSLLPVIDHPACAPIYRFNQTAAPKDIVAGIIKLTTIDRSEQPFYGAIKKYMDSLAQQRIYVENQDLGYELSNITTDKFIVGAQEIDMYYFSTNADRDTLAFRKTGRNGFFPDKPAGYEWTFEASLEQQVLPYYGKLGNNAVTIPKGFGAYQQVLLDATSLNAGGVGAYYVATEMELRCALISFDRWKEFLKLYNDTYMDSLESNDAEDAGIAGLSPAPIGADPPVSNISTNYAVSVPRSVFDTYVLPVGSQFNPTTGQVTGGSFYDLKTGLPLSPCNPPYGYPLYYKRMTQIGIPEGGLTDLYQRWVTLTTNIAELQSADRGTISTLINSQFNSLKSVQESGAELTQFEKDYYEELEKLLQNPTPRAIDQSIGTLENIVKGNGKNVFAILPSVAKKNTKNALKVYNFVKSIAEECLGKKFLVKIPSEVNLFYDYIIKKSTQDEYTQGPFGFKPRSTKNIAGYEFSPQFKSEILQQATAYPPAINMMQSFLSPAVQPNSQTFGGALRINWNPLSDKYESNYTPMNLGGYFPFDLYQNTLGASAIRDIGQANYSKLPLGVQQLLVPQDLTNFISDGRISPYVRFDNAEDLTLEGLNDSDFTQQFINANGMIPDLVEALDNTGPDEFHTFPNFDNQANPIDQTAPRPKQVAFVKCSVDEELYLPPRFKERQIQVHGQFVKDIGTKSIPNKIFAPCSGVVDGKLVAGTGAWIDSFSFYKANFVPLPRSGQSVKTLDYERYNPYIDLPGGSQVNNSVYVYTEKDDLNIEHAYALITLPNRISPNKDSRYRDGQFQTMNAEKFKHLMTMDTVRGLPGFNLPSNPPTKAPRGSLPPSNLPDIPINSRVQAWFAMKKVHQGLSFGLPQQINMTVPSPVYPDLVALPLMSNDRCYGPWVSSQLDGQTYLLKNIGGRVDFIKDENLSPWNYGGYDLMNEAGRLQAEFSNSLMLFTERGSFTIPDLPRGNSLCRALIEGGPLVTSINVDVSTGGMKTTYQMDLYTASFGKLQKQKQEEISKISRERKKLTSERNNLIRKGLGKNQSARNFQQEYNTLRGGAMPGVEEMGLGMANAMTRLAGTISKENRQKWSSLGGVVGDAGSMIRENEYNIAVSMQDETMLGKTAQAFPDQFAMSQSYYNSASIDLAEERVPISHGPHANMSYRLNSNVAAHNHLLNADDEEISVGNDTLIYGDRV